MTDPGAVATLPRFDDLRALVINCTLKRSPARSHTQGLIDRSTANMAKNGVGVEVLRAVDQDIATGVWPDMTEHGWPLMPGRTSTRRSSPRTSWFWPGRSGWVTTAQ